VHNHSLEVEHASSRKLHEASFSADRCSHVRSRLSPHAGYTSHPRQFSHPHPRTPAAVASSRPSWLPLDLSEVRNLRHEISSCRRRMKRRVRSRSRIPAIGSAGTALASDRAASSRCKVHAA